jgi:hypothetical protein
LPFGPHVKIITIDSDGKELLPRPSLNEEDDIYIAIVNLDYDSRGDYYFNAPLYTTKPFDQILNNIYGLGVLLGATASEKALENFETTAAPSEEPSIEYYTLVFYLGNFHGQANMRGGLNVNYQIQRCKKNPVGTPECENFVQNGISLADSSSTGQKANNQTGAAPQPQNPDVKKTKAGASAPANDQHPVPQKSKGQASATQPTTQDQSTVEKKPEIQTSGTLKVHNLYRFKATGGIAMATFDERKFKDANTFDPVIGLSCFLFDKKNASQPFPKWYDKISLWGGISLDDPLMKNIFVGPAYEIVDGLDISAGYNHQELTRNHGGGEDHKDFIDSVYVAFNVDLNIFQTFQKIANGMKPADTSPTNK